jgi:CRISPR-associated endonuclease/helicase Cas3
VDETALAEFIAGFLVRDFDAHPASFALRLLSADADSVHRLLRERADAATPSTRAELDWATAMCAEFAPGAASQLLMVRRDYLEGNIQSVLRLTAAEHLRRTLFQSWDYQDALQNQSLHWEPSEDRRHAYQWHEPNGDPTRRRRGGMLGANRLALEAWPVFFSAGAGERLQTRGFTGTRVKDTNWTWPLWFNPLGLDAVASLLALPALQETQPDPEVLQSYGIVRAVRCGRILVGKTPNLTPAVAV